MASSVTLAITYILSEARLQSQITLITNIYQKKPEGNRFTFFYAYISLLFLIICRAQFFNESKL